MKRLHFKTACMEKPSSLMQIPSKTTKERHGHIGKSFCFFINNTLEFCSYKALGFPVVHFNHLSCRLCDCSLTFDVIHLIRPWSAFTI